MRTENGTDAESESRSKIYFDYAEQQGGKDRKAGLERKGENGELRAIGLTRLTINKQTTHTMEFNKITAAEAAA
ncbi:MAG: hypothetical protein IKB39_05755, partial [Bacteroidaceae bacterium]|nr:hypothetical protein [Bacteroidaceae bacterium]